LVEIPSIITNSPFKITFHRQTKKGILRLIAKDRFASYSGYQNIILTKKINKYKSHSAADNFHQCGGANLKAIIFVSDPHVN